MIEPLALLLLLQSLLQQDLSRVSACERPEVGVHPVAQQLHGRALDLSMDEDWEGAAISFSASASVLPRCHSWAIELLRAAARMHEHAGETMRAYAAVTAAADRAIALRFHAEAAESLLDAAMYAHQADARDAAVHAVRRVSAIAHSGVLSEDEDERMLERFSGLRDRMAPLFASPEPTDHRVYWIP